MSLVQIITAIPLNFQRGSGCFVGTSTLISGLRDLGINVAMVTPRTITPNYTATRLLFNEGLRRRTFACSATIGIDADGYSIPRRPGSPPHIACIKGVLGDAVRFESGFTRISLGLQADLEARHARRSDLVITISRYCADRLQELYGVRNAVVVPELIDLAAWRQLFRDNPATPDPNRFTILCVCRFYPRKRLDVLLRAAALLRDSVPELEVRIVGNGPADQRLRQLSAQLKLETVVRWLGDAPIPQLAEEYNRCHAFCLPSAQEGFGIVFLEAMAAGKPIVAARAAAVPEVVQSGILVDPENPEALAEGIARLYRSRDLRDSMSAGGLQTVQQYEKTRVAARFLSEISEVAPDIRPRDGNAAGATP